jgi:tRNA G18 (ribose-2'-O)-methylase SpoU
VLEEVGWVQQVIINQRTGNLVDGHLRCQLAAREGNKTIPVLYVDIDEAEEELVLATLDPIAAMAATDKQKLDELFQDINSDNENVQKLISEIATEHIVNQPTDEDWMAAFDGGGEGGNLDTVNVTFVIPKDRKPDLDNILSKFDNNKNPAFLKWIDSCLN